jgi:hypothetical protein
MTWYSPLFLLSIYYYDYFVIPIFVPFFLILILFFVFESLLIGAGLDWPTAKGRSAFS